MAMLASFLNALNILSLFFAGYFALRVNTVGAWILWAVSAFLLGPLAFWAGLSSYAWSVFFVLANIIVLILTILASIKACNNNHSCCTTDGRAHCGKGKKKGGCFSNCGSSCCSGESSCCSGESSCCSGDSNCCSSCENDCDDDDKCDKKDKSGHRKRKPTRSGGSGVHYD